MQATQDRSYRSLNAENPIVGWQEALTLPGCSSLYQSMVKELAEYMGEPPAIVAASCELGAESVAAEWNQRRLRKESPPQEVLEFYRTTRSYLFDLTVFNANYPYTATLEALLESAKNRGFTKLLDFGSGIGSVGLFFARNGMQVALADISEPLQDYVAWRFKSRELKVTIINLDREELPKNTFEVVTALDVLEHLSRPANALNSIAASMKVGGLVAFNVTRSDPAYPQHIASYEEIHSLVPAMGLRRSRFIDNNEIFERVEQTKISKLWHRWWGKVFYGFLYRKALFLLELFGIKRVVREWIKG